jgi:predicted small metal-binding protein
MSHEAEQRNQHTPMGVHVKQFSCGDVVPGCRRTFRGSENEIMAAVAEHARVDHQLTELPPGLVEQVRGHIVAA